MSSFRFLAGGLLAAAGAACAADIPLEQFARHPQYEDAALSPDGEYLAAVAVVNGKRMLSLIHLTDFQGVNVAPRGDDELADFLWAGPHRVVYSVGTRLGGLEKPVATGELFGVDADGGQNAVLFGYRVDTMQTGTHLNVAKAERATADLIGDLPEDEKHVLILVTKWSDSGGDTAFPEIRRMDVRDGKTVSLFTSPLREPSRVLSDHAGNLRFVAGADADNRWQVFYRDVKGKGWEKVYDQGDSQDIAKPLAFDRSDETVYWSCAKPSAAGAVCTWSAKERAFKPVWSDPVVLPTDLVTSLDRHDVVGVRSMPGRVSVAILDKNADTIKLLAGLMPQFPGDDVRVISSSRDGRRAVVLVESDVNPGQYYLYDKTTKKLQLLFGRWPELKPESLAPMEPIEFKARDGVLLRGYLTRPPGKAEAKNLPLVVLVHGGPFGVADAWAYDPEVQMLASRGFAVLQVNFRGSGGRGKAFEARGYKEWGGAMQDDLTDGTRWAIEQGAADPKRICIMGTSYGGYAALEGAAKEPDLYRCAIGYVGVYDLAKMYTDGDISDRVAGKAYLRSTLGTDPAELAAHSPINQLDRLKANVMLVVGGQDQRVPPVQGESLHAALLKRGVAHEWLYKPDEGHGFYDERNAAELFERVTRFLDGQIGGGAAAGAP